MYCPKCSRYKSVCTCGYYDKKANKLKPNYTDVKKVPNNHTSGKLSFINISTRISRKTERPSFKFENSYYTSEEFAIKYYNSKGYNAFFSENEPWKILLRVLFRDVFKKFERISKKKGYKYGFYDNEFFTICEDEINNHINYLKTISIVDEIERI